MKAAEVNRENEHRQINKFMMTNERFKMLPDAKYYFPIKSLKGTDGVPGVLGSRVTEIHPPIT